LQSSFAAFAPTFVMPVLRNAKSTKWITAKDARRHAGAAPKNVEKWLDKPSHHFFI
jgi:hypothetical protein